MAEIRRVFVDTSAWLALMNRNDQFHASAVRFHQSLSAGTLRVTAWGIVAETYTWLRYHMGYRAAERWLLEEAALEEGGVLEVVLPDRSSEAAVRAILSRFADQDLSYVDAVSLQVVHARRNIDAIFAFDHHLHLSGVPVLPGDS